MLLRIFTIAGLALLPSSIASAEVLDHPQKTMHYEISSDLGGQRKAVFEHRQERRQILSGKYAQLSEEERAEIRARIDSRFGHLSPEERQAKLDELHQYREKLREELEQLPPESRMERMKELRQAYEEHGLAAFDEMIEEEPDVDQTE